MRLVETYSKLFLFVIFVSLSGCAFGTRHVDLGYSPSGWADANAIDKKGVATSGTPSRGIIWVGDFTDERFETERIGAVENSLGMRTASVQTDTDVTKWVRDAVKVELEHAGFEVQDALDSGVPPNQLLLSGSVLRAFSDSHFTYRAKVKVGVAVETQGEQIFKKLYSGDVRGGLNWASTGKSYGRFLSQALQNALQSLPGDLNSALNVSN